MGGAWRRKLSRSTGACTGHRTAKPTRGEPNQTDRAGVHDIHGIAHDGLIADLVLSGLSRACRRQRAADERKSRRHRWQSLPDTPTCGASWRCLPTSAKHGRCVLLPGWCSPKSYGQSGLEKLRGLEAPPEPFDSLHGTTSLKVHNSKPMLCRKGRLILCRDDLG